MAKSLTCFSKSGEPLTEYTSEFEAQNSADYQKAMRQISLYPYHCSKCNHWHLSPIHAVSQSCSCTDSLGQPKNLYETIEDAETAKNLCFKDRGIYLNIYPCPAGNGFHLTHH